MKDFLLDNFLHYAILCFAIGAGFFVQTIVGFAAVLVALPILLIVLELHDAIMVLSILLALFSAILIIKHYPQMDKRVIRDIGLFAIIGLLLGIFSLRFGNPTFLIRVLGVFIIFYAATVRVTRRAIPFVNHLGWLFGLIGGFFSGLFNTGGPLYVTYVTNRVQDSTHIRATLFGLLGMINIGRIPLLFSQNMISISHILTALLLMPIMLGSIWFGNAMVAHIQQDRFKQILLFFLTMVGISLLVK